MLPRGFDVRSHQRQWYLGGQALCQLVPLFKKLDEGVVDEYARLEGKWEVVGQRLRGRGIRLGPSPVRLWDSKADASGIEENPALSMERVVV